MPSNTRSESASSRSQSPPSYGTTKDLEANAKVDPTVKVRMEPAWVAWHRERMQILGPVQQDKRILLWAWMVLCIIAITLGVGLGLAYKRSPSPST